MAATKALLLAGLLCFLGAPATALLDGPKLIDLKGNLTLPEDTLSTWAVDTEPCTEGDACPVGNCTFSRVACDADGNVIAVDLSGVGATGKLPGAPLAAITTLESANFAYNDFSGAVPGAWAAITGLGLVNLTGNAALCGPVPEFLAAVASADTEGTGLGSVCTLGAHTTALADAKAVLLDSAGALATWEAGTDPCGIRDCDVGACDWEGIKCTGFQVTGINLASKGLGGPLPPSFGSIGPALETLDLSGNVLGGAVPAEWAALAATTITVTGNDDICGSLPEGVPELTTDGTRLGQPCATLAAHVEALASIRDTVGDPSSSLASWVDGTDPCGGDTGTCGPRGTLCTWEGLTCSNFKVTGLELASKGLTGDPPAAIGSITTLVTIDLSNNDFSGSLPDGWSQLGLLVTLSANGNRISGGLPGSWGEGLAAIDAIDLSSNVISGAAPADWSKMTALTRVKLDDNRINGELPASWGSLPSVVELRIARNQLSGLVPIEWQQLAVGDRLQVVDLQGNARLCVTETFFPGAEVFNAGTETGSVCDAAALITIKDAVEDPDDHFSSWEEGTPPCNAAGTCDEGSCPWSHVTCFNNRVTELWLANKKLKGTLPDQLALSTDLEVVYLHNNRLRGFLPGAWAGLRSLRILTLAKNDLEGEVPEVWGGLENLEGFFFNDNDGICGWIPGDIEDKVMSSCNTKIGTKCGEGEGWTRTRVAKLVAPLCGLAFLFTVCYCQFKKFWHQHCPCCKSKVDGEDKPANGDAVPVADPADGSEPGSPNKV